MSKYYKVEDIRHIIIQNAINNKKTRVADLIDIPTIEVSEDCISRLQVLELLNAMIAVDSTNAKVYAKVFSQIKDAPSVIPKTQIETQNLNENSNIISISDGISEMIRCAMCNNPNQSYKGCDGACSYDEKLYKRIMDAINASRVEVSEDCISREWLEEEYWQTLIPKVMVNTDVELGINIGIDKMHDVIKHAPSVVVRNNRTTTEQSSIVGEWIKHDEERDYCSVCKHIFKTRTLTKQDKWTTYVDDLGYNFCPNCGARMFAKDTNVPSKKGATNE